jgi:flagellar biosynthetic protein FliP
MIMRNNLKTRCRRGLVIVLLVFLAIPVFAQNKPAAGGNNNTSVTQTLQKALDALTSSQAQTRAADAAVATGSLAQPSTTEARSRGASAAPGLPAPPAIPPLARQGSTAIPNPNNNPVIPMINLSVRNPTTGKDVAFSVQLLLLLTVLSLAPSFLILMTSFLRVSIVLDFIKRALSLQQVPPNTVLMGISLFLTLYIMWPTFTQIYDNAAKPLADGQISVQEAFQQAQSPLRIFMYDQMKNNPQNIRLFMSMRGLQPPRTLADVPTYVLIPAFILNELTVAFKIGILLYIPFIIIDMVVASALMSMGMMMLPPSMISTPFKLILFILVDGWDLLTQQVIRSFV